MYHHFETKIRQITQTHWVRLLDVQIDADMQGVDCSLFVLGTLIRFDEHSALRCFSSNNLYGIDGRNIFLYQYHRVLSPLRVPKKSFAYDYVLLVCSYSTTLRYAREFSAPNLHCHNQVSSLQLCGYLHV